MRILSPNSSLFLREHWIGLAFSLIVGLIYVAPNLIFIHSTSYKGLPMIYTDAESMYLSRINRVYKGCIMGCNPYIKEYADKFPFFDSSFSEGILALPGVLTNTPIIKLKIVYEFLLPAILFLLAYFLIFRLTTNKYLSIFGASFIVLAPDLLNSVDLINFPNLIDLLRLKIDYTQFLMFSRPVNPQFSSIFFLIYLHVLLSTVIKKNWKWFGLLAITYGLSFYIYFFTYAFATVVQGVWIGIYVLRREWRALCFFSISTLCAITIAIPQFIEIIKLFQHPFYPTIPTEYLVRSHIPDISLIGIILLLVFIVTSVIYLKKFKSFSAHAYFVGALILACFITRNEHVISGMIMQYSHFEAFLFGPIFVVVVSFFVYSFVPHLRYNSYTYVILFLISLIPVFSATLIQYQSYKHWLPYSILSQKYVPVLDFLKDRVPPRVIISAPEPLSSFIPMYTPDYVLSSFYSKQWVSVPERTHDIVFSRTSAKAMDKIGSKYGVDYYVEEKKSDIFLRDKVNKEKVFEDENFVVYKAHP